jgi:predicted GH43/DUF377 family glycosyl hydrolase
MTLSAPGSTGHPSSVPSSGEHEQFPYRLVREGLLMSPESGNDLEAEGVLNPAAGRAPDGTLYLFPRLVASGNVSRIGRARIDVVDGVPRSVERLGLALEPDRSWERGAHNAGVEDPRVTRIDALGLHVMTYVAYGPLGPRTAIAISTDLEHWQRLGPVLYRYDDDHDVDLNLFHNKDTTFLPEPVVAPDGVLSLAVLHRPMWDLSEIKPGEFQDSPSFVEESRQSIWMSFVPLEDVQRDVTLLTIWSGHRFVAGPAFDYEEVKIGGGPPPVRVAEGWLLLHHGVTGVINNAFEQQQHVNYAAGGMILDADKPWEVLQRSSEPLLAPETAEERSGIVPNVVFPTAIEEIEGELFVFYGMADSQIGVARIVRSAG